MARAAKKAAAKKPRTGKGKTGAPQQYDRKATVKRICAGLLEGKPMALICREIDIPVRTVNQWRQDDEAIANQFDEAFEAGKDAIAWRMRMTARGLDKKKGGDSTGDVERDRLIIYTDEKLLAKWDARYGNRLALANDPKNPLLPPPTQLTEAQLLAIAAQGIKDESKDG
jgi:hypothetical protein